MVKVLLVSFLTKHYPATEWSQKMKLEPPTALQPIAVATTSSIIISVFFGVLAENYRFESAESTKLGTRTEKSEKMVAEVRFLFYTKEFN